VGDWLIGVRSTLISNLKGKRLRGADNNWGQININFLWFTATYAPSKLMLIWPHLLSPS
jgi:hypothetical protein